MKMPPPNYVNRLLRFPQEKIFNFQLPSSIYSKASKGHLAIL